MNTPKCEGLSSAVRSKYLTPCRSSGLRRRSALSTPKTTSTSTDTLRGTPGTSSRLPKTPSHFSVVNSKEVENPIGSLQSKNNEEIGIKFNDEEKCEANPGTPTSNRNRQISDKENLGPSENSFRPEVACDFNLPDRGSPFHGFTEEDISRTAHTRKEEKLSSYSPDPCNLMLSKKKLKLGNHPKKTKEKPGPQDHKQMEPVVILHDLFPTNRPLISVKDALPIATNSRGPICGNEPAFHGFSDDENSDLITSPVQHQGYPPKTESPNPEEKTKNICQNNPDFQPVVMLVDVCPKNSEASSENSSEDIQPVVEKSTTQITGDSLTLTDTSPIEPLNEENTPFHGFTDSEDLLQLILLINRQAKDLENLKMSQIYLKKHNVDELKKTSEVWRETFKKCAYAIQDELKNRGQVVSLSTILEEHGFSLNEIGFNLDSMDFDY